MLSSRCLSFATSSRAVSRTFFPAASATTGRYFGTSVKEAATADDALRFSGYSAIDFTIPEDAPVYDAVQKFAAFNIGCLVTVDAAGKTENVSLPVSFNCAWKIPEKLCRGIL